jgi:hypothetical protein
MDNARDRSGYRGLQGRGLPSVGAWATMLTLWLPPGDLPSAEAALTGGGVGVFLPPPCQERPAECPSPPPGLSAPPAAPPTSSES